VEYPGVSVIIPVVGHVTDGLSFGRSRLRSPEVKSRALSNCRADRS